LRKITVAAMWKIEPNRARGKAEPSGKWLLMERDDGELDLCLLTGDAE
jgi:hypothetical protein